MIIILVTEPNNDLSPGSGDYTIAAWVKFNTLTGNQRVYKKDLSGCVYYWYSLWKYNNSSNIYFDYGVQNGQQLSCNTVPEANVWYFFVETLSRDSRYTYIYRDGVLLRQSSANIDNTADFVGLNNTSLIGTSNSSLQNFNSYMQDLRVYKRYFSSDEVLDLYNATKP